MRIVSLVAVTYLLTTLALAQKGLEGQPAKDPELVRALDAASAAFLNAQRDAAAGKMLEFRDSLNLANLRWAECYGKYREWPTSDTAWRPNFDAINNALLNAVNQVSPGNNLPAAKVQIDSAASTLTSLRSRNGVLDVLAATENLTKSVEGLQTTIAGLQGRPLTPADITALKTSFGSFRDNYSVFTQAAMDANAFGLGQGELESLRKLIAVQNIGIDTVFNILSNPDTPGLVTQWQSLRDQILTMLTDLRTQAPASEAVAAPQTTVDNGQPSKDNGSPAEPRDRPRLLPRLRR
ncbi:MAG: hypothetical protein HUU46_01960 [Candidatus Hydrogenedentes bacterium]|nr:hypothetical protein [Candidatus Hydrogenedentota bacterium]